MKHFCGRVVFSLALVVMFTAVVANGATISIGSLLANPSFEIGGGLGVCPTSWTCSGSPTPGFNSYAPNAAEYTAGADGLPGSKVAPDGTMVASSPTPVEGSGQIRQTGLGIYIAGNTYTLDLWIGTPRVVPAVPATPAAAVGVIKIDFLGTGGGALLTLNASPSATAGQWTFQQFSFTPTGAQVGQSIGLMLEVDSQPQSGGSGNNRIADFDIAGAPTTGTPEPGTLTLLGLGFLAISAVGRIRAKKRG